MHGKYRYEDLDYGLPTCKHSTVCEIFHYHNRTAPSSGFLTLTGSSCRFAAAFSRQIHRARSKHLLFPPTLMCPGLFLLCGVFMLFRVLCSQDALDAICVLLSAALSAHPAAAEEVVGSAPGCSPASNRMVIQDLWLVKGCLLSPPLLQLSGDIIHVDLRGFSVLNSQSIDTLAARCTLKCARQDEQQCHPSVPHAGKHPRVPGERDEKNPEPQALRQGDGVAGLPQ